jgi:hypothetical protein
MEGTSQVFLLDVIEGRNQNRLDPRLQKHKRYSCKNKKRHITDAITRTIKVLSNQIENGGRPQAKAKRERPPSPQGDKGDKRRPEIM